MSAETGSEGEATEEQAVNESEEMPMQASETMQTSQAPEPSTPTSMVPPQAEGRRTQLKIVRERLDTLSKDVGSFRKSTEANTKRLESHLKSIRKDLSAHTRSKELDSHAKSHQADTKRLEKQIATLRQDMASLRSQMAKDAAKGRAREEAAISRLVAKVKTVKSPKKPQLKRRKK